MCKESEVNSKFTFVLSVNEVSSEVYSLLYYSDSSRDVRVEPLTGTMRSEDRTEVG